ncbi:hypothetical protein HDC89_000142 [Herbaspirillum sp. SJZ102]|nr:hypothetical protein [Herbaspirillum sp. SJZ102]
MYSADQANRLNGNAVLAMPMTRYGSQLRRHCSGTPRERAKASSASVASEVRPNVVSMGPNTGAAMRMSMKLVPQMAASRSSLAIFDEDMEATGCDGAPSVMRLVACGIGTVARISTGPPCASVTVSRAAVVQLYMSPGPGNC